jgi:hypothetical protein
VADVEHKCLGKIFARRRAAVVARTLERALCRFELTGFGLSVAGSTSASWAQRMGVAVVRLLLESLLRDRRSAGRRQVIG